MLELENEESAKQEISDWALVTNFEFLKILKTVNKAVKDKLYTKVDGNSISMIPVQHFLQKIDIKNLTLEKRPKNFMRMIFFTTMK